MAEYEFEAKVVVTDEMLDTLVANLEHEPPAWLERIRSLDKESWAVSNLNEEGNPDSLVWRKITREGLAKGLAEVAFGRGARSDLIEHARAAIFEADPGEIDGEISDCALQYAVFDEITFW